MTQHLHIIGQCYTDAESYAIQRMLIEILMRQKKCCPVCLEILLRELASESSKLWTELNSTELNCTHHH